MMKTLACALLAGLASPVLAAPAALDLPAEARIDVEVIDSITLDRQTASRSNVLLRPVHANDSSATHRLPDYCLITANARLETRRVQLSTRTVTCIESEDEARAIYSGELSATAVGRDGELGLAVCAAQRDNQCMRAELAPGQVFQLSIGRDTRITALENPSEQINQQRRRADGEGVANPVPSNRPDPDSR